MKNNGSSAENKKYSRADHTFVICAYRESPFLESCVRSVIRQALPGHVVVATSTPNDHIRRVARRYHLPLYVRENGPAGIATDWNFAISCADTSLVTIAHQDDVYSKRYLEEILRAANESSLPMIIFTDYAELRKRQRKVTAAARKEKSRSDPPEKRGGPLDGVSRGWYIQGSNLNLRIKRMMLLPLALKANRGSIFIRRAILSAGNPICCPSVTYVKRNLPGDPGRLFKNNMKSNIDWQAWERISRERGEFVYTAKPLMAHRIYAQSTTSEVIGDNERVKEDLTMYRKFWPAKLAAGIERFYKKSEESNGG